MFVFTAAYSRECRAPRSPAISGAKWWTWRELNSRPRCFRTTVYRLSSEEQRMVLLFRFRYQTVLREHSPIMTPGDPYETSGLTPPTEVRGPTLSESQCRNCVFVGSLVFCPDLRDRRLGLQMVWKEPRQSPACPHIFPKNEVIG